MTPPDAPPSAQLPGGAISVRAYAQAASGSHRCDLGLESYQKSPLDPGVVDVVALLSRLERSALGYLRSVLVTPTHSDAELTAFLVTWAYEKYWLADALEQIAAANPAQPPAPAGLAARLRQGWHTLDERFEPIRESVVANLIGEDVIAVHCVTAAIDEWLTEVAYHRLADHAGHDQLSATLTQLLAVKRRQGAFFAAQARDRLAAAPSAQALARRRLRRTPLPLGSRDEPQLDRLLGGLVTASDLAALDRRCDSFPGLSGLHPLTRSAAQAARRAPRGAYRPPTESPSFESRPR